MVCGGTLLNKGGEIPHNNTLDGYSQYVDVCNYCFFQLVIISVTGIGNPF